jgi:putative serine protease PepD
MSPIIRPSRTAATLGAALLVGAGGGAGAALAIDGGGTTHVVTTSAPAAVTTTASSTSGAMTVTDVYKNARQGVVDITVQSGSSTAEGTGIVFDKSGDIVTNQHVVDGASSVVVKFADGSKANAKVVGSDASSDIAVIKVSGVDSSKLHPLSFGDSSQAQVGNGVIAIGSPYGLQESVTVGVVSAIGRTISSPNHYTISNAIQTDAPINHGNSGGPLLDSQGDVMGVNAQIESDNGENTGVGFAIPSNTAKSVAEQIISGGKASHPFLGLELTDAEAGTTVAAVTSGGPGAGAGIQKGDVITAIDGQSLPSSDALVSAVQAHKVGDKVTLTVKRGGATKQMVVTLGNRS